jgi:hypothetical protein
MSIPPYYSGDQCSLQPYFGCNSFCRLPRFSWIRSCDLPCVVARLRFHLGELPEVCDGLFEPLLDGFSLFRHSLGTGGILDGRLPLRERFPQDLIAPIDKRLHSFKGLPIRLSQRFHILALPIDERRNVDAGELIFVNQLFEIIQPGHRACVRAG